MHFPGTHKPDFQRGHAIPGGVSLTESGLLREAGSVKVSLYKTICFKGHSLLLLFQVEWSGPSLIYDCLLPSVVLFSEHVFTPNPIIFLKLTEV